MSSTHRHLLLDFFWQVISGPPCIGPTASGLNCQKKKFQMRTHNFFYTSDRDFYSKKNSVSQVYTYLPKIQKNLKNTTIVDA
jgi:hypothetical protein